MGGGGERQAGCDSQRGEAGAACGRRAVCALDVIVDRIVRDEQLVDCTEEREHERRVERRVHVGLPRLGGRGALQVGEHALLLRHARVARLRKGARGRGVSGELWREDVHGRECGEWVDVCTQDHVCPNIQCVHHGAPDW